MSSAGTLTDLALSLERCDYKADIASTPLSARARFISSCLREGLNPRASLLIRRKHTSHLNLSHMAIGDKVVKLLSAAIADVPEIESLNFTDDMLTGME